MTYEFIVSYIECQSCTERVHCEQCEAMREEALMRMEGITGVELILSRKYVAIETDSLSREDIEDLLEEAGLFVE